MCTSQPRPRGHKRKRVRGLLRWFFSCQKESVLKPARPTLMGLAIILHIYMSCPHNDGECGLAVKGLGVPDARGPRHKGRTLMRPQSL